MRALQQTWDLASGLHLDEVCPGYGEYVSGVIEEIGKGMARIRWEHIKKQVIVASSCGTALIYRRAFE